jgi:starch synthase
MAAAENAALPGGKVGGVGDVIRDLPAALASLGCQVTVVVPEYGMFATLDGAREVASLEVEFAGSQHAVSVIELPSETPNVRQLVLQSPHFTPQGARIYCDDGAERPFATDAGKFAFFAAALASFVTALETPPDAVHLHDWHTALYCVLRAFDSRYAALLPIRTVYTIHNLALQGVRPFDHDASSLAAWYYNLNYDAAMLADPQHPDCINPMAAAIRLADVLHTVSPTYAREVQQPDDPARGFHGGEGLHNDLAMAQDAGRLIGIPNGATYEKRAYARPGWRRLLATIEAQLQDWRDGESGALDVHEIALDRLRSLPRERPADLLTSIGRLTDQKAQLFMQTTTDGVAALEKILLELAPTALLVVLGSGDPAFERRFAEFASKHPNLLFLCGYSETLADLLYQAGDLFLMPSSFEPCGISQMLAMRASQPCVVHGVGGLKDTVLHGKTGFVFSGESPTDQADNFASTVRNALLTKNEDTNRWLAIRHGAAAERFSWSASAQRYIETLYDRH